MEHQLVEGMSELAETLRELYRDQERAKALNMEISEFILSCGNGSRREWVQLSDSSRINAK